MSSGPTVDTVSITSSSKTSTMPNKNNTSGIDSTGLGLSSVDSTVTELYNTADQNVSTTDNTKTTIPPFTAISTSTDLGVSGTGRNSIIYKNIFTSELRTSDLQADTTIHRGNQQGIASEPKVYLRQLVDTTPREVVDSTGIVVTTINDIGNSTDTLSAQVTTESLLEISTALNLNESGVTERINNVSDAVLSQPPETSTIMESGTTLNLNSSIQTDSYLTLDNQTTDQTIVNGTQFTATEVSNRTSVTTEQAIIASETTNTVVTLNDSFTTVVTNVDNSTDPYDMYGTNNSPAGPGDYFYDYYTYSEIPENQTSISVDNITKSSTELFNNTTMYTYSLSTTEGFTNTTIPDPVDPLTDTINMTSSSESFITYPYQNDSTMNSLDYITESVTLDTGSTYPALDTTNRSISAVPQTTQDTFGNFTTEASIKPVTGKSSLSPLLTTGSAITTTVEPIDVNVTTNDIVLNDTVTVIDQAVTGPVGKPDQQIVNVSNTLFDRVLFPTPKPNQDIVKVPEQITIFPSRYQVPATVPTRTTVTTISKPTISTSSELPLMTGEQTENMTALFGKGGTVPSVGTTIIIDPITQPSTDGTDRRFSDVSTSAITPPPLVITETVQEEVTTRDRLPFFDETTIHGSDHLSGKQSETTMINIPVQDFQTSSESMKTNIDTTTYDKTPYSITTDTQEGPIRLDLSTITDSLQDTSTDKKYQQSTSQTNDKSIISATFGTFTNIPGRDTTGTMSFGEQPISREGTLVTDTGIPRIGSNIGTRPIIPPTERIFLSTADTKLFEPNAKTDAQIRDAFYSSTPTAYVQRSSPINTSTARRVVFTDQQTEANQQSTITEQVSPTITMQSSTNIPASLGSDTNLVNGAGQSLDSVSYLPDINGLVDGIGGIPIQPGMFIDIFIPKFRVDSEGNEIILEELNSTKLLPGVTSAGKDKGSMDVLIEGLSNRERLSNDLKSANQIQAKPQKVNYMTFPNMVNLNRTSLSQFRPLIMPASATSKGQGKANTEDALVNQFSNFVPNFDRSQRNKEFSTRAKSPEIFINSLEAPEVMPPIIVPRKTFSENSNRDSQSQSVFIGTNSNSNSGVQISTTARQGVASNTIWKGPGVGISGQSLGLFSETRDKDSSNRNTEGFNNLFGVTGPVYIPINEISIPWKDADSFKGARQSQANPDQVSKGNEINTTFSTLWDLNRLNKNITKETSPASFDGQISDQLMPPYIGIPLLWSSNPSDDIQMQGTTRPSQKNWNDLPVPDIMPPIKVRLLNLTSQGTFVDNGLNKTDDMNRRILLKLETIVGELQRNRALLTQTLDVSPALEQGLQLSFDRFPTQFTGLNGNARNPDSMFGIGGPRRRLLSEVLQEPVQKVPIVEGQNVNNAQLIKSDQLLDPRGNLPISEVKIGSSIGTSNLLNMLGITETRPLTHVPNSIDIKLNEGQEKSKNQVKPGQTLINTDSIENETYPLFSATLRALTSPMSISQSQNISESSVVLDTTFENQTLYKKSQDHVTKPSTHSGLKITTTTAQGKTLTSTEQVIVDAQGINSTPTQTEMNQQTFVTNSNQVVVVPTGTEFTNPFEGTNITLPETTTARTPSDDNNRVTAERVTPSMVHDVTTSGQRVVLATDTMAAVNSLRPRNYFQRNMTAEERERDRIVRINFNKRVLGIKSNFRQEPAGIGKYNLGQISKNNIKNFQPMSVDKDFFLNELNFITKDQTPNELNLKTKNVFRKSSLITEDKTSGKLNNIAKTRKSTSDMNSPNLQNIQLSEFSEAPPVNEKIITVSEVPTEAMIMKIPVSGKDYIVNSNADREYLANTGVMQINNVEKVAIPTINPSGFTEAKVMSDSIQRMKQEAQIKPALEKLVTQANHMINSVQEFTTSKKQLRTSHKGTTESLNIPIRRQLKTSLALSQVPQTIICPEGQSFICKAVGDYSSVPGMKWWCFSHCKNGIERCPEEKCLCTCEIDYRSSKKQSSISDIKVREKKIINLTLNGSKEVKITVPIQIQPLGQYQDLTGSPERIIDTTYESILLQNNPMVISDSVFKDKEINQPSLTESNSDLAVTGRLIRKKRCIGINAFAGKPEIDRWCTRMCSRNVCPPELCACKDIRGDTNSNING